MSGRRAKALRKEFIRLHKRAPETRSTRANGILRWLRERVKHTVDRKAGKEEKVVVAAQPQMAVLVSDSYSEFRRFKREWRRNRCRG